MPNLTQETAASDASPLSPPPVDLAAAPLHGQPLRERRASVRFACQPGTLASVHPCGGGQRGPQKCCSATALLCDISEKGLGLLLGFGAGLGAILEVDLLGLGKRRTLIVRVAHIVRRGGGWLHGCEAANPLVGAELREMLSHR